MNSVVLQRRRHFSRNDQDIIVCCNHFKNFFIDMNGLLVDYSSKNFCQIQCTRQSQIYVFVCINCFEMIQNQTVNLFAINYAWEKQYIDKEDIKSIHLNRLYRFCSLNKTKSGAFFNFLQLKINF